MTQNNTVAVTQNQMALIPTDHEMMVYDTMAKQAAASKLYLGIGSEFAIKMVMLRARELNVAPMTALDGGIHIIQGRTEISARLMGAMIFRAGHSVVTENADATQCTVRGTRSNGTTQTASFTMEDAKTAGLIKVGGGWQKYPQDMLYARALSRLARRLFPDVIGTGYVEGEIRESFSQPVVEIQNADCVLENEPNLEENIQEEQELLKSFLSKFDNHEAIAWGEYMAQIREKMNLPFKAIIDKYNEDPIKVTEKFKQWIGKHSKTA